MQQTPGLDPNMNFITCLLLFLAARPKRRELISMGVVAIVLLACFGIRREPWQAILQVLSYGGAGGLVTALLLPYLSRHFDWKLVGKLVFPPAFGTLTSVLLAATVSGVTYDNLLYAFDGALGFQPDFWAGRVILQIPGMSVFARFLYEALPLFLATAYVMEERRGGCAARNMIAFLVLLGLCGAICFRLFPAVGSVYLYPESFPFNPPELSSISLVPQSVTVTAPRNCMPSLHCAWAIAFLWTSRRFSRIMRWVFTPLVAIMLLQTLEYHYLVDMIVAVPFTLAIYALTRTAVPWAARERWGSLVFGITLVLAWLLALRWFTPVFLVSEVIPWGAALLTVGLSWFLRILLDRAEARHAEHTSDRVEQNVLA